MFFLPRKVVLVWRLEAIGMGRGTHWFTVTVSNRVKLTGHTISDTFGEAQHGTKLPDHRNHDT
jgi:hypothetical protein